MNAPSAILHRALEGRRFVVTQEQKQAALAEAEAHGWEVDPRLFAVPSPHMRKWRRASARGASRLDFNGPIPPWVMAAAMSFAGRGRNR